MKQPKFSLSDSIYYLSNSEMKSNKGKIIGIEIHGRTFEYHILNLDGSGWTTRRREDEITIDQDSLREIVKKNRRVFLVREIKANEDRLDDLTKIIPQIKDRIKEYKKELKQLDK